ncbi:MAG: hypothetical protein U1E15_12905 [Hyphomicrobiales bacterium]
MKNPLGLETLKSLLNPNRRDVLKWGAASLATSLVPVAGAGKAQAFAYEPYPKDDDLETVVTSCAHNCGSRHMLVAHKKGDVIVRLSTDNGSYQGDAYGTDTEEKPQIRACLRGRSYRLRLYSPERLLYPMKRVGKRGEGWDSSVSPGMRRSPTLPTAWSISRTLMGRRRCSTSPMRVRPMACCTSRTRSKGFWALPRHVRLPHHHLVCALL